MFILIKLFFFLTNTIQLTEVRKSAIIIAFIIVLLCYSIHYNFFSFIIIWVSSYIWIIMYYNIIFDLTASVLICMNYSEETVENTKYVKDTVFSRINWYKKIIFSQCWTTKFLKKKKRFNITFWSNQRCGIAE